MGARFLVIDGYNLLHAAGLAQSRYAPGQLARQRQRLLARLAGLLTLPERSRTTIIFDARDPRVDRPPRHLCDSMQVVFARPHGDADLFIQHWLAAHPAPRHVTLVSGDRELQRAGRSVGARIVAGQAFLHELDLRQRARTTGETADEKPSHLSPAEAAAWLREFGDAVAPLTQPPLTQPPPTQPPLTSTPTTSTPPASPTPLTTPPAGALVTAPVTAPITPLVPPPSRPGKAVRPTPTTRPKATPASDQPAPSKPPSRQPSPAAPAAKPSPPPLRQAQPPAPPHPAPPRQKPATTPPSRAICPPRSNTSGADRVRTSRGRPPGKGSRSVPRIPGKPAGMTDLEYWLGEFGPLEVNLELSGQPTSLAAELERWLHELTDD